MKTITVVIQIEDRQGIFVPRPREILQLIRRKLQCEIVGVQRWSNIRSLTALNATVHEMIKVNITEVTDDAAPAKAG